MTANSNLTDNRGAAGFDVKDAVDTGREVGAAGLKLIAWETGLPRSATLRRDRLGVFDPPQHGT
jgi:hypothetical protein